MGSCLRRNPGLPAWRRWGSASASFPQSLAGNELLDFSSFHRLAGTVVLLFTGSLRRQGPILQPFDRRRNGFLPAQEPRIARMAPMGISFGIVSSGADWKRITGSQHLASPCVSGRCSSLQDPCEGRDPSRNRSIAGGMGSCLHRNPELPHGSDGDQLWHRFPQSLTFIGFLPTGPACGRPEDKLRQGPIMQPPEIGRNGSLPAQGPGTSPF